MKVAIKTALNRHLASHHGVISRVEALDLGVSPRQIRYLLGTSRWQLIRRNVYAPAGIHLSPEAQTLAACLAVGPGTVASHASAAWLWELLPQAPRIITVSRTRAGGGGKRGLEGIHVHRRTDLLALDRTVQGRVPVTTVPRTLCDLGEAVPSRVLDEAIDRAIARRLATGSELTTASRRLARRGRSGPARLRAGLQSHGVIGAPHPSVLEAKVLRLLLDWGVRPLKMEAIVLGGAYRLDFLLAPRLALEVDGFTYHASPAAKAADTVRRNQLVLAGFVIIQSDWLEVTRHPERLKATVLAALKKNAEESPRPATPTPPARPRPADQRPR